MPIGLLKWAKMGFFSKIDDSMRGSIALFAACFFLSATVLNFALTEKAQSAAAQTSEAEKIRSFALELFGQGEYYRAITEFKRLKSYYPNSQYEGEASFMMALSYFAGKKWDDAALAFREVADSPFEAELRKRAQFMVAESYYRKGDFERALKLFEEIRSLYGLDPIAQKGIYKKGWANIKMGRLDRAAAELSALQNDSYYSRSARAIELELMKWRDVAPKRPRAAGLLDAILPGAGHLYAGEWKNGVVSFLLNGSFIAAAAIAFANGNPVLGAILGFVELGWYAGTIFSAVNSAHKLNKKAFDDFLKRLETENGLFLQAEGF